ncbi:MAG: hypothetical protein AAGI11_07090 [Pseudomonadota bacterium]
MPGKTAHDVRRWLQIATVPAGLAMASAAVYAQSPEITVSGLPAEPLIGEQFCVDASFTNGANTTGFGPYLIITGDEGLSGVSISYVDIMPELEFIGTFDASGTLIDPISETIINGSEGGVAYDAFYPIGSVEGDTPPLVMEICGVIDIGAEPNVPLEVTITPGFEFGDTATGENGAILGPTFTSTVTPQIARVSKDNSAPEAERPPGPSHPFTYSYTLDISQGLTLNDVFLEDILPVELQYTGGPIDITAPLGVGCEVTGLPNFEPTPGGKLVVECDSVTGTTGAQDLFVTLPVYITDILDESIDETELIVNTVNVSYDYEGDVFDDDDTSEVLARHVAVQKSVAGGGNVPGAALTYTINFQVTDYPENADDIGANVLVVTDNLPDGLTFEGNLGLFLNGIESPLGDLNTNTTVNDDTPSAGATEIIWDLAAAIDPGDPRVPNATEGRLEYEASIDERYDDPDGPVQAGDNLSNSIQGNYMLDLGASGDDGSSGNAEIAQNEPDKVLTDPADGDMVTIMPGSLVTFTLSVEVPAGSTTDLIIADFLPSPVFDVSEDEPDVFFDEGPTADVDIDTGSNAVILDYGDIDSPTPTSIEVRIVARVTSDPYADELFLTNLMQTSYSNTNGQSFTDQDVAGILVGAPELAITKGIASVANDNAELDPDPVGTPVDSDASGADASDTVSYRITVENVGTQPAFTVTVRDPEVDGLSCDQSSIEITDGEGASVSAESGDLADPDGLVISGLAANEGDVGPPYGEDTIFIDIDCTLESDVTPLQEIVNTASVTWTATDDGNDIPFPAITDDATVVIAAPSIRKTIVGIEPNYTEDLFRAQIGEIVTYRVEIDIPEGVSPDVQFEDFLDVGLAHVDVISLEFPAGVLSSVGDEDFILANNLGYLSAGGGPEAPDRRLVFGEGINDNGFGDITNEDEDNSTTETIILEYRARVLNSSQNVNASQVRNRARFYWKPADSERTNVQARARRVTIVEPAIRVVKTLTPAVGDNTTPPAVDITFEHTGASTGDAYDLVLTDKLPIDFNVAGAPPVVTVSGDCTGNATVDREDFSDKVTVTLETFELGSGVCNVSFATDLRQDLPAGVQLENCAELEWHSLYSFDQPLDRPPTNTIGVERTGDVAEPGGSANTYNATGCDIYQVFGVGIIKDVFETGQSHTDETPGTPPGTEALTIGETVDFELIVTLPLADALNLEVTDLLPRTEMVLELVDARTTFVGSRLTPSNPDPDPVIIDTNDDQIPDQVTLDYGQVAHEFDDDTIIGEPDRIRIIVEAKVLDVAANTNNDREANQALVRFFPDTNASDDFPLELVEPILEIEKTGDRERVEASDPVTYTVTVRHSPNSRTDAQGLVLDDLLPAELVLDEDSVMEGAFCTDSPEDGPSGSGQRVSATWIQFDLGAICEITFSATVSVDAVSGETIPNKAEIAWSSLNEGEQPNDADDREYTLSSTWEVVVSEPGLFKEITATSVPGTSARLLGDSKLTIGEEATFSILATFPDGTTLDARLQDQLPDNGVALRVESSRIVTIGEDLVLSANEGEPGIDCNPASIDCVAWVLGTVVNQPDEQPSLDPNDSILFEVVAVVLDDAMNSGAPGEDDDLVNVSQLTSSESTLTDTDSFDVVEPQLRIQKQTSNGTAEKTTSANEREFFTLIISHQSDSTAAARSIEIQDTLSDQMLWVSDDDVVQDCAPAANFEVLGPGEGLSGQVIMSFDVLTLEQRECEITFPVDMSPDLPIRGTFLNRVDLLWESAPGSDESRTYVDRARALLVSVEEAAVVKLVRGTALPETGSSEFQPELEDVNIGERVEYAIALRFAEGETSSVVIEDTYQSDGDGQLELTGGELLSIGSNITILDGPAEPVFDGNVVTVDFGTVRNSGESAEDLADTVIYRLELRATDVDANTAGDLLSNEVELRYAGLAGATLIENDSVSIEVVEPELTIDKTFVDLTGDVATIEIEIGNTGSGPAYDLMLVDEFDANIWTFESLEAIELPSGAQISETLEDDKIIVTIASENPSNSPPANQVLSPGESTKAIFSLRLRDDVDDRPTEIPNTAVLSASSLPGEDDAERDYQVEDTDILRLPALDLLKAWSGPNNPALPGDTITFTLTLQNTGDAPANNVVITDSPDDIGELQAGSVSSTAGTVSNGNAPGDTDIEVDVFTVNGGAQAVITYNVVVPLPYPAGVAEPEQLVNQATVTSTELPDILSDDPATEPVDDETLVPILADPIMSVSKTDGVLQAMPGDVLTYLITYGNLGNQDATGVILTETVPDNTTFLPGQTMASWECGGEVAAGTTCIIDIGELAGAGTSFVVDFVVAIDDSVDSSVVSIFNEVFIEEDGLEFPDVPSEPSTDSDTDLDFLQATPNLVIGKGDGGISVVPGQGYSYGIIYGNTGNQEATGVVLTETVPLYTTFNDALSSDGWICDGIAPGSICEIDVGSLPANSGGVASFGLFTDFPAEAGVDLIDNTAVLADDGANTIVGQLEVEASDDTPLIATPDMVVQKTTGAASVLVGDVIVYDVVYRQQGNQDATGVIVREIVPLGTEYVAEASSPEWSCTDGAPGGSICVIDIGFFEAGASGEATFAVRVLETPASGEIVNIVETNNDGVNGLDPTPPNNADIVRTTVIMASIPVWRTEWVALLCLLLCLLASRQLRRRVY